MTKRTQIALGSAWEDGTPRVAQGIKDRVNRLKAIGNGQVPSCLALAWNTLRDLETRSRTA